VIRGLVRLRFDFGMVPVTSILATQALPGAGAAGSWSASNCRTPRYQHRQTRGDHVAKLKPVPESLASTVRKDSRQKTVSHFVSDFVDPSHVVVAGQGIEDLPRLLNPSRKQRPMNSSLAQSEKLLCAQNWICHCVLSVDDGRGRSIADPDWR
jgi:hypothetical protein